MMAREVHYMKIYETREDKRCRDCEKTIKKGELAWVKKSKTHRSEEGEWTHISCP